MAEIGTHVMYLQIQSLLQFSRLLPGSVGNPYPGNLTMLVLVQEHQFVFWLVIHNQYAMGIPVLQ